MLLIVGMLLPCITLFVSCKDSGSADDGKMLKIVNNGESEFQIVRSARAKETIKNASVALRNAIRDKFGVSLEMNDDYIPREKDDYVIPKYEILIGNTEREETATAIGEGLTGDRYVIKAVGNKIVICGANDKMTESAVGYFIRTYITSDYATDTSNLALDRTLSEEGVGDYLYCIETGLTYEEMARDVYSKFRKRFVRGNTIDGTWFWDAAEMLETFVDAYEATKDETYLSYVKGYASAFEQKNGRTWLNNEFNDDIMWITIAYLRIYLLTGEKSYYNAAKAAFDGVYRRAWDTNAGGMFWKTDNASKNSCVNCPAAIAACYIAQISKDDSYNEKATAIIDWVVEHLSDQKGHIYDSYTLESKATNTWASTYNQGTFIGACTLIYQNTNDEKYIKYADDAVKYTIEDMFRNGVVNVEDGNNHDLHGFKGILTRWVYRYAVFKNDRSILEWLQLNAMTAYSNRNSKGLIWTSWGNKTDETKANTECAFGFSTAVALMFNSLQWWDSTENAE